MAANAPKLVEAFYDRIWNQGDLEGPNNSSPATSPSADRSALNCEGYRPSPTTCAGKAPTGGLPMRNPGMRGRGNGAFAKMRLGGRHVGFFRGYRPTVNRFNGWAPRCLIRR